MNRNLNDDNAGGNADAGAVNRYPWIISPSIDYLFVAGGAVWIMLLANYFLIGTEIPFDKGNSRHLFLLTVIFLSQHVFFDAHNVATYFRLWGSEEDKKCFKFYRTWLLYVAIGLLVIALVMRELIGVLVFLYLVITFWHYAMQSFGIALIYCSKRNYNLNVWEKEVFRSLMLVASAYVIVRFFTAEGFLPYSPYGIASPFWIPLEGRTAHFVFQVCTVILAMISLAFAFVVFRKLLVEKQVLPAPVILLLTTIALFACAAKPVNILFWLYIPALYHASQYLAVSLSYYLKERGLPDGMDARLIAQEARKWPALNYLGKAILIGCTIYIVVPHMISLVGLAGYDEAIGLVFVVINFHHFATDAAIWQLRDARIRKILVE